MGAIFYKQPNGRYCRYSTVVDCVTDYNMSEDDIIDLFMEKAFDDAMKFIRNKDNFKPFKELTEQYEDLDPDEEPTGEMTVHEFENIKKQMYEPVNDFTKWTRT